MRVRRPNGSTTLLRPANRVFLAVLLSAWLQTPLSLAFEAGAAKVEITPPLGTPLDGVVERYGRGAESVHDPLWARSLYLSDGQRSVLLVSLDLFQIPEALRERVLSLAPPDVSPEHIILTATHTRNGPGGMARRLYRRPAAGPFMPELVETTARSIARSMGDAIAASTRAAVGHGSTKLDVLSVNRALPDGPVDDELGVIRVEDSDGNIIALLAKFSAHPETVPEEGLYAFSADYPGAFCTALEGMISGGGIAFFLNGAVSAQVCANPKDESDWNWPQTIGEMLALRVKGLANEIECREGQLRIGFIESNPPNSLMGGFLPGPFPFHTLQINDLLIPFLPGEHTVSIADEIRILAMGKGFEDAFTISLANDRLCHFTDRETFGTDSLASRSSHLGPFASDWVVETVGHLVGETSENGFSQGGSATVETIGDVTVMSSAGAAYELGYQRGRAASEAIQSWNQEYVFTQLGAVSPDGLEMWRRWTPPFVDTNALSLPFVAAAARPLTARLPDGLREEIQGLADGAGLPFDSAWLMQAGGEAALRLGEPGLTGGGSALMAALDPPRLHDAQRVVALGLTASDFASYVVHRVTPSEGQAFLYIGRPWDLGVWAGMNENGVVIVLDATEDASSLGANLPPIPLMVRQALEHAQSAEDAIQTFATLNGVTGYRILISGPEADDDRVIELDNTPRIRNMENGLLFGAVPEDSRESPADRLRYHRISRVFGVGKLTAGDVQRAITDESRPHGLAAVFVPDALAVRISKADAAGGAGEFVEVSLRVDGE